MQDAELHLMQPTLNAAKDSKDIMPNLLKFPVAWWLYDPVNKNKSEPHESTHTSDSAVL